MLSFSPVVGIGTPQSPYPQASVLPPPLDHGGYTILHTRLRERGWGSPNSDEETDTVALYMYVHCGILPYSAWRQMSDHNSFYAWTGIGKEEHAF
jgi:hypothetical protein